MVTFREAVRGWLGPGIRLRTRIRLASEFAVAKLLGRPFSRTQLAQTIVSKAEREARRLGAGEVRSEHLLIALLKWDPVTGSRFFGSARATQGLVRALERELQGSGCRNVQRRGEYERIVRLMHAEARQTGHQHPDPEHLLLALICDETLASAEILKRYGLTYTRVRDQLSPR